MINNNTLLITGINKVIEGLTDIKGVLMLAEYTTPVSKDTYLSEVTTDTTQITNKVVEKVEELIATQEVELPVIEDNSEPSTNLEVELNAMSLNEVRAYAKERGIKAGGSKASIIERILQADDNVHNTQLEEEEVEENTPQADTTQEEVEEVEEEIEEEVEEEVEEEEVESEFTQEDEEEYRAFLEEEFELNGLREIADLMELSVDKATKKDALIDTLISDMPKLHEALDEMGCFQDSDEEEEEAVEEIEEEVEETEEIEEEEIEEEEEEEEEDSSSLVEELGLKELSQEELADILAEYGLSTKGMKTALIDRILLAVKNGIIEVEDDAPKLLSDSDRIELEKKIFNIETERYESKELTPKMLQAFLKKYYMLEKEFHNYKKSGLSNMDALGLYIKAQQSLLDDYGTRRHLEDAYLKNESYYCCGRKLTKDVNDDNFGFCSNCGSVYEVK